MPAGFDGCLCGSEAADPKRVGVRVHVGSGAVWSGIDTSVPWRVQDDEL